MEETRLKIAKKDIVNYFENSGQNIYNKSDIETILSVNRKFWRLLSSTKVDEFLYFLVKETKMKRVELNFSYRKIIKYIWNDVPLYTFILSLKDNSYFSHYTAIYFNDLTEQIPKTIYLNQEQALKGFVSSDLEQERIDAAFKRPVRISKNTAIYKNSKIVIINGKNTGQLGVIDIPDPDKKSEKGAIVRVTNIERTLIDATVRPVYSGGVFEVLKAYKMAKERVSVNKLSAMLKQLNFIYPYHQAIGFYLEKSGVYNEKQIKIIEKYQRKYDFYLTHQMKEVEYSKKWKLFYPKGF